MKLYKKNIEQGMREAARNNGSHGRSITHEAIGRATRYSSEIIDAYLLFLEQSMPPVGGRGSRMKRADVELPHLRFTVALSKALEEAKNMAKEEEE